MDLVEQLPESTRKINQSSSESDKGNLRRLVYETSGPLYPMVGTPTEVTTVRLPRRHYQERVLVVGNKEMRKQREERQMTRDNPRNQAGRMLTQGLILWLALQASTALPL